MTGCEHRAGSFQGMRKARLLSDGVLFECGACGATFRAGRCVGARTNGSRCTVAVRPSRKRCWTHANQRERNEKGHLIGTPQSVTKP